AGVAMALCPGQALAAGFQNMSQSATANGMGSVGVANVDEPNASFYNPAIMSFQKGFNIYVGNSNLIPATSFTNTDGETTETLASFFPPPNLHVAVPITENLYIGGGVTFPYGLGISWPEDWEGRNQIVSQNLQTINFNPNVSYKIPGLDLSVAVGGQFYTSTVELSQTFVLRDDTDVPADVGLSGTGFGYTAGVFWRPADFIDVGVGFRSGTTIDYSGRVDFQVEEGTANPLEGTFVDQEVTAELNIPNALTAGVGYTLDRFFLEFDTVYTLWSAYERLDLEFSEPCEEGSSTCDPEEDPSDPPTTTILNNWDNSFAFRLGLQYALTEALKLRAGAVFDLTPIPNQTLAPSLPGNDRAAFSLGAGYTIKGIRLDGSYQFINALERQITADNFGSLRGTYKTTAHVIGFNVGYGY
ncbi:MAG: outer membrane protein transport protein, partial [Myxococcota bacterium]